ncbi:Oidioi.mRNA.OKI2018_I69.chr1.g270.t1.cds [Oikopleura dioica]|uniref:choline-phosphate cytidylyltransferase n=1 Tax=Oikopleura dioica TaxID=34765 RepID=A0ABN7SJB0_OIKDI|nr:Oidioi.mRNA.OKI2018_I69.chr1.g270.t1.cds [Oikopleura dioica]
MEGKCRDAQNNDWKPVVKYENVGPAEFFDPKDFCKGEYKRVTKEEALAGAPCRVYADGVYDVFHAGHARQLMQAKNYFPNVTLIVGVSNDGLVHKFKGQTVCTDEERYEAIRHCKYVDIVLPDAPWTYSKEFFDKHKIDFIAHDEAPYTLGGQDDSYALPKSLNMFCPTERTEGISTSDMITRVVKNYDGYIRRNLSRGYNRRELNVGPVHSARLKTENVIKEAIEQTKEIYTNFKEAQVNRIRSFLEIYVPHVPDFVTKGLDAISPQGSPPGSPRRMSVSEDASNEEE